MKQKPKFLFDFFYCSPFLFLIGMFFSAVLIGQSSVKGQSKNKFVIILDAGHGGKDPGNSYHGFIEKEIALKTSLKLEQFLKKDPDIKVVYTRETDVFIPLKDRPKKANSLHANLFISIHCNSVKDPSPYGAETFVMGLSRSKGNLEIAKQENSVILLEKDYKNSYKGFDPKNPLGMVGLQMLQEDYLNRSISLASKIQNNFIKTVNRKSRGIKQTPLWVLDAVFMPSVLIELGFLSNKPEGLFLNSDSGQRQMAEAIANAIQSYKKEYFGTKAYNDANSGISATDKDSTVKNDVKTTIKTNNTASNQILFTVQFAVGPKKLALVPSNFKGLKQVEVTQVNPQAFAYFYGGTTPSFEKATENLKVAQEKGFTTAYIIAFKNGQKISLKEALK